MRCSEHRAALKTREKSNLWNHCVLEHNGEQATFKYKVERKFHKDSMLRQIKETWKLESEPGTIRRQLKNKRRRI